MPRKKGTKNKGVRLGNKVASKTIKEGSTPSTPVYKTTLKSLGRVFKAEGATLEEALRKIKIPNGAKAMAVLKVERGDQVKERIINGIMCQRLFGGVSPTMQEIGFKQIKELIGL